MSIFGVDYAYGNPDPAKLKKAGVKFVCRYLSTPGNAKNLTRGEAVKLKNVGIQIVVVFEKTAGRALAGRDAGAHDARSALVQAKDCGMPLGSPIYFAVDFDASPAQQSQINAYLSGAVSVLGKSCVGVYGSYYVCKRAFDAGVCNYGWQTYAWSGGQWENRCHLQQYKNGQHLAGISCDFDRAVFEDYGQWRTSGPIPKPKPKPKPVPAIKRLGENIFRHWNPFRGKWWRWRA